jgi:hypothetical protein
MDLQERIELWKSIDPDPEFCRKAEREMLLLSCRDEDWVNARMRDFEKASGTRKLAELFGRTIVVRAIIIGCSNLASPGDARFCFEKT